MRRLKRFTMGVLHADDPPDRLALGAAIGMFITFTPTIGFQMPLALFLAWLLRANKAIGLPIVWISNPATMIPIFLPCYLLGCRIMGRQPVNRIWWDELIHPPGRWLDMVQFYWLKFWEIWQPVWVGGGLIGFVVGYFTYYAVYHGVRGYRMRRWGQLTPPLKTAPQLKSRGI